MVSFITLLSVLIVICLLQQEEFKVSQFNYLMEVGSPTTKMYHFTGTIPLDTGERVPLSKDNLLLRDCTLRNTDYIEGIVVYAGRFMLFNTDVCIQL